MEFVNDSFKQSGCNFFATKRTNKTAVAKIFYTSNTVSVWCLMLIMCITMQSMQITASAMILQRHSKKHTRSLRNETLQWVNPCRGEYVPRGNNEVKLPGREENYRRRAFGPLLKGIDYEHVKLQQTHAIDTSDIKTWYNQYNRTYKFLPKLKPKSNLSLTRWHRNVQVFIASFGFLHRRAEDDDKYGVESSVAKELKTLLTSAQRLLCEIETAINSTRRQQPFKTISAKEMKEKLTLRTNETSEVDEIDLKFVKSRYIQFVETTQKMVKRWFRKHRCMASGERSASSGSNSSGGSSDSGSNESSSRSGRNPCHLRKRRRNARLRNSSKF